MERNIGAACPRLTPKTNNYDYCRSKTFNNRGRSPVPPTHRLPAQSMRSPQGTHEPPRYMLNAIPLKYYTHQSVGQNRFRFALRCEPFKHTELQHRTPQTVCVHTSRHVQVSIHVLIWKDMCSATTTVDPFPPMWSDGLV